MKCKACGKDAPLERQGIETASGSRIVTNVYRCTSCREVYSEKFTITPTKRYMCPHCGKKSLAHDWDKETAKSYDCEVTDITSIIWGLQDAQCLTEYICPVCKEPADSDEILVVK